LSISSSLIIIWIVFKIFLHLTIYCYIYDFQSNIYFNNLISIKRYNFFDIFYFKKFELSYYQYTLYKILSVLAWWEWRTISKNSIYDKNLWTLCVFTPIAQIGHTLIIIDWLNIMIGACITYTCPLIVYNPILIFQFSNLKILNKASYPIARKQLNISNNSLVSRILTCHKSMTII
jgi:hypothetical protein